MEQLYVVTATVRSEKIRRAITPPISQALAIKKSQDMQKDKSAKKWCCWFGVAKHPYKPKKRY